MAPASELRGRARAPPFAEGLAIEAEASAAEAICARLNLAIQAHELGDLREMAELARSARWQSAGATVPDFEIYAHCLEALGMAYPGRLAAGQSLAGVARERLATSGA